MTVRITYIFHSQYSNCDLHILLYFHVKFYRKIILRENIARDSLIRTFYHTFTNINARVIKSIVFAH